MRRALVVATVALVLAGCAWARPRFDPANTGHNGFEPRISAGNVAQLTEQYVAPSATTTGIPAFVSARGHLFVGGNPIRAFDVAGVDGCSGASPRACTPQWKLDTFGAPDVIGKALYAGLIAYDADGATNCGGTPKTCTRVWNEGVGSVPAGPTNPDAMHFDFFRGFLAHGGEYVGLTAYDTPCPPIPADCPLRWGTGSDALGGGANGGVLDGPAVADTRVFAAYSPVGQPATLRAFDGTAGSAPQLWSATLDGAGGTGIAVAEGVLVVGSNASGGSKLEGFDAAGVVSCSGVPKTCQPLWVTDAVVGGGDSAPAIANGVVYRAVGSQLRAYDLHGATGCTGTPKVCTPLWSAEVGAGVSAPAVANGLVYVAAGTGTVRAYDAAGVASCSTTTHVCTPLWTASVGSAAGPVAVGDGHVLVGTVDGRVHAFGVPAS
jgi:outer membrane protein assembly factor BamB